MSLKYSSRTPVALEPSQLVVKSQALLLINYVSLDNEKLVHFSAPQFCHL